jgi:hypothetical protein
MKISKYEALRILADAYWHAEDTDAVLMLSAAFHKVRRSLSIADVKPNPKRAEGYNPPRGMTWL